MGSGAVVIPVVVLDILTVWQWARRITLGALFAGGLALAIVHCSGCGGALLAQARAAAVGTVALEGAHRTIVAAQDAEQSACSDATCVLAVRASYEPARIGYEVARSSLSSWVSALELTRLAGAGEELLPAMLTAAARFVSDWRDLAGLLAARAVVLAPLPDFMLADVEGGSP